VQDKAAEDSVVRMIQTGETFVTDGEQRASSFATYPIVEYVAPFCFAGVLSDGDL